MYEYIKPLLIMLIYYLNVSLALIYVARSHILYKNNDKMQCTTCAIIVVVYKYV